MKKAPFNYKFLVSKTPKEVFNKICLVSQWWSTEMEGVAEKLHDVFTVRFGESFVQMEVVQNDPEKRLSWLVKNCFWSFLDHKNEWNDTIIDWNITDTGNLTQVSMSHVGLRPGTECFDICKEGWGLYAGNSLYRLITEGSGIPFEPSGNQTTRTGSCS